MCRQAVSVRGTSVLIHHCWNWVWWRRGIKFIRLVRITSTVNDYKYNYNFWLHIDYRTKAIFP